jgi:predicted DCC family thiol-disulfide oxidoreductase YuxK
MTDYDIEVFYDGDCPLCMREIRLLRELDKRQLIRFVDIAAKGFDAASVGVSCEALIDRIYGRLPDGTLIEGVEVFRRLYATLGLAPLVTLTRLPGIAHALDLGYRWLAKNRLRPTGRCTDGACKGDSERSKASLQVLLFQGECRAASGVCALSVLPRSR